LAVYLLHFDRPVAPGFPCRHYLGFADGGAEAVERRVERHKRGNGARLVAVARERGIGFVVARIWPDGDRNFERRLKRQKSGPKLCPICRAAARARKAGR